MGKHFSNTGQIIQLGVSIVALVVAAIKALPSIHTFDFLSVWPLLFYFVLISISVGIAAWQFGAVSLSARTKPPKADQPFRKLPEGTPLRLKGSGIAFRLALGERRVFASDSDQLLIEFLGIEEKEGEKFAKLVVDNGWRLFQHGDHITGPQNQRLGRNTYYMPRSNSAIENTLVYCSFDEKSMDVDSIRVTHINEHANTIDIAVARCTGYAG